MTRITPLEPPYTEPVAALLASMMPPGLEPIALFRTFARNEPMAAALRGWGGYALSADLSLTLRDREIVIDRVTARCGCEYEWGVHVDFFADAAGLDDVMVASLVFGTANDDCWQPRDRLLIAAVDTLHDHADVGDGLWHKLAQTFTESELLDLCMLVGWYQAISFTANAARVPLEPGAPRFSDYRDQP